jgi:hypothetical protein
MGRALIRIAAVLVLFAGCGSPSGRVFVTPTGGVSGSSVPPPPVGGCPDTTAGANVLEVVVDPGPPGLDPPYTNGLFASATICEPGTCNCQTFDHLLVDTGSFGVRVLESLLSLALPDAMSTSGQALAECFPFVDGTAWGPVKTADVWLGSQQAAGLSVQLIGEQSFVMPTSCTGSAITEFQTLAANGILGVGTFVQDCGPACALSARSASNPGWYYACSSASACAVASVPLGQQVSHPVASLPVDNNGVIIQLPGIPAGGAPSVSGQMILGIGTQANNGLGSATPLALDPYGYTDTTFPVGGTSYRSLIDSGSNGLFFLDSTTTKLAQCTLSGYTDWYCPSSTTSLSATVAGDSGPAVQVDFSVANALSLFRNTSAYAFDNLAGDMPGYLLNPTMPAFDWGLPFFFGRTVYTAIENQPTPAGVGPFIAF